MEIMVRTVRERYLYDNRFHTLVETFVSMIWENKFTPSEVRDAATLASIIYEERRLPNNIIVPEEIENWLNSVNSIYRRVKEN